MKAEHIERAAALVGERKALIEAIAHVSEGSITMRDLEITGSGRSMYMASIASIGVLEDDIREIIRAGLVAKFQDLISDIETILKAMGVEF